MAHYRYYEDANGIQHASHEDACHYYGVDTPQQAAQEEAYYAQIERDEALDRCNEFDLFIGWPIDPLPAYEMECPF